MNIVGVDLSLLQHLEDSGVVFRDQGHEDDALAIFQNHGVNMVRLRLFLNPDGTAGQVNDLPYTLRLAKRVKDADLSLLLDFHYSDVWADPQMQKIPAAWAGQALPELAETVRAYTAQVMERFFAENCLPDMVQIGNEVTQGMLWPISSNASEAGWDAFARLVNAGIQGARAGGFSGPLMIHVDQGGKPNVCGWFYDHLLQRGVSFDVIGLSYYPFWHGTLADLRANLAFLADRYQKPIVVVETGHDWRGDGASGSPFPATPQGQQEFLLALADVVQATPDGLGAGLFYWAPEWVQGARWGGPDWSPIWESRALFDENGNALPAMKAFSRWRSALSAA